MTRTDELMELASCGKTRYMAKFEADLAMSTIQGNNTRHRHRKFREEPQRSYHCPTCKRWHLTKGA